MSDYKKLDQILYDGCNVVIGERNGETFITFVDRVNGVYVEYTSKEMGLIGASGAIMLRQAKKAFKEVIKKETT